MKTLLLVRHAKSSWKDESLSDLDRPLNKRGLRNAPEMGRRLAAAGLTIDCMVTSQALRARLTAEAFAHELNFDIHDIIVDDDLYGASEHDIGNIVRRLPSSATTAVLFGHNPTLTEVADSLSDESIENVPTCGVLVISVPAWDLFPHESRLVQFDDPRRLPDS